MLSHGELILRITLGAVLGGMIGYERTSHGRQVGLRTHFIVAMAAATFMVISHQFHYYQNFGPGEHSQVDISRIASTVVSGIGFLAGGAILKTGITIHGLTTAAGLWLVTSIGMASGAGMYPESLTATFLGLVALTTLRRFEAKDDRMMRRHVIIEMSADAAAIPHLIESLEEIDAVVTDFDYKKLMESKRIVIGFDVRFPEVVGVHQLIQHLEKQDGIREVHVNQRD